MGFAYSTSAVPEEIGDLIHSSQVPVTVTVRPQPEGQQRIFTDEIGAATGAEITANDQVVSDSVLLGQILNNMHSLQVARVVIFREWHLPCFRLFCLDRLLYKTLRKQKKKLNQRSQGWK